MLANCLTYMCLVDICTLTRDCFPFLYPVQLYNTLTLVEETKKKKHRQDYNCTDSDRKYSRGET